MNYSKKVIWFSMLVILGFLLMGCNPTSEDTTSEGSNQSSSTIPVNSAEGKEEIGEKIDYYISKLILISGLEMDAIESELSYKNSFQVIRLSDGYTEYDRDDLPEQVRPVFEGNGIDPEIMENTIMTLTEFLSILELCDDFVEDEFFNVTYNQMHYIIKMNVQGDKLYIESYRYILNDEFGRMSADIMMFDLVDEMVYFEYVRDYSNNNQHNIYYDLFSEFGNIMEIALDANEGKLVSYQMYNRETDMVLAVADDHGKIAISYFRVDGSKNYFITVNSDDVIDRYSMRYGFPQSFWYTEFDDEVYLTWNLYETDGWNKCRIMNSGGDQIFLDDVRLLEDFTINFIIADTEYYKHANARITIPSTEFTETVMDLSDYGLEFNVVTYQELQSDINYISQNYGLILEDYGLTADLEDSYVALFDLYPFQSDATRIEDILGE